MNGEYSQKPQQPTPELIRWVATELSIGQTPDRITENMRNAGWADHLAPMLLAQVQSKSGSPLQQMVPEPALSHKPLSMDLGDQIVHVGLTLNLPKLTVFHNFLKEEECEWLINTASTRLTRSKTVDNTNGGEQTHSQRTSEGMFFQRGENDLIRRIEERIAKLVRWPVQHGEGLQVLKYGTQGRYDPHFDYFEPDAPANARILSRGGQRVATFLMYLQSPFSGGGTIFPDAGGLEVQARKGDAVFFVYPEPTPEGKTLHGGSPVLSGEKWVATKWLRQGVFL